MWQSGPPLPPGIQSDGNGGLTVPGQVKSAAIVVQRYWDTEFPNDPVIDTSGGQIIINTQGSLPTVQMYGIEHDPAIYLYNGTPGPTFGIAARIRYDGTLTMTKGIAANGSTAPDPPPTIEGSRAAMGVGVYALIQALVATGVVIDGTTA